MALCVGGIGRKGRVRFLNMKAEEMLEGAALSAGGGIVAESGPVGWGGYSRLNGKQFRRSICLRHTSKLSARVVRVIFVVLVGLVEAMEDWSWV